MNREHIIKALIEDSWENRENINTEDQELAHSINEIMELLDQGVFRVAEKKSDTWVVNQWVKKAILLSFRMNLCRRIENYPDSYDKQCLKFTSWSDEKFKASGIRALPGNIVRHGAYIGSNVVLLPSFVNIGAYVDEGTMVDTWATVGSCAQIGKNCHISGGAGIGGVLEPLQANPTIIEDNCFIGARSEIVEGVIVGEGTVIGMGVFISASTPIIDRHTGETVYGKIPPYSVVISGTQPSKIMANGLPSPHLPCAVIVKQVDERTRSKTSVNELLRI